MPSSKAARVRRNADSGFAAGCKDLGARLSTVARSLDDLLDRLALRSERGSVESAPRVGCVDASPSSRSRAYDRDVPFGRPPAASMRRSS